MVINVQKVEDMKKSYINPELNVIEFKAQHQILAGSEVPTGTTPTSPGESDAPIFDLFEEI